MNGQRKALIIACDTYEQEGLGHLLAPAADAVALSEVLGDPKIGDFAVDVVYNQPSHITQAQIENFLSQSRPDDVLLLHFSCHGLKSESGELFSPHEILDRTFFAQLPSRLISSSNAHELAGRAALFCYWTVVTVPHSLRE